MPSRSALVVLGMHRSGTSALTGALRLCGAWVGDSEELTVANRENPQGFWERRDIRRICDQLLHKTQADWWKLVDFDPQAIPAPALAKQGGKFAGVVSLLNQHPAWVIKEPRLCLLLPVLLEHLDDPVCIHIYRNPLEVARSLQARNRFGIGAGLALWEAYNVHALRASEGLPRVLVSFEQLMTTPLPVINELADRLEQHSVHHLSRPDPEEVEQLVDASLYRRRATDAEAEEYLSPSQLALWLRFRNGAVFEPGQDTPVSAPSRQQLLDLELTESELNQYREKTRELDKSIATAQVRGETIKLQDETIKARNKTIKARGETIKARGETISKQRLELDKLRSSLRTRNKNLEEQTQLLGNLRTELDARKQTINGQKQQIDKLRANLEIRNQTIRKLHDSASWKVTAPLRILNKWARWFWKNFHRVLRLLFWVGTGQFSRATKAALPYYKRVFPRTFDKLIPAGLRKLAGSPNTHSHRPTSFTRDFQPSTALPPTSTYIVTASWWEQHSEAADAIARSDQAVIIVGSSNATGPNCMAVDGMHARSLALAAVATETAIEIGDGAKPVEAAWPRWREAVAEGVEQQVGNVRLLTTEILQRETAAGQAREIV